MNRLLSKLTSAERKKYPMASGLLDYFPDALAYVSHVSYLGNEKHNPGQPLHWARGKSMDHADCQLRHMVERGSLDDAGVEHLGSKAWRALAELQEYLEQKHGLDLPRAAQVAPKELAPDNGRRAVALAQARYEYSAMQNSPRFIPEAEYGKPVPVAEYGFIPAGGEKRLMPRA